MLVGRTQHADFGLGSDPAIKKPGRPNKLNPGGQTAPIGYRTENLHERYEKDFCSVCALGLYGYDDLGFRFGALGV